MSRAHKYPGKEITIYFDAARCIHAGNCVHGLPDVFNTGTKGPWIKPDGCDADAIARLIETCPSGALHYERASGNEATPEMNTITVEAGGPLLIHADYTLNGITPDSPRTALCRCGASKIKPWCDGSHASIAFPDNGEVAAFNPDEKPTAGKLDIRTLKDGPLYLVGPHQISNAHGNTSRVCAKSVLCRCGASKNKPYCEGSHAGIGFKAG